MGAYGYESWFVSARDPVAPRALWIRHTRHRPSQGPESVALWCTVLDGEPGRRPAVIKQVLSAFPPEAAAGPGQFRGQAVLGEHSARWDLAITGQQPSLRPLRPPVLYRAPLPRTKLEAVVPDGQVTGMLQVDGRPDRLAADVYAPGTRLRLSVTLDEEALAAVTYADPRGGTRTVTHAALASMELAMHRPGDRDLTLSSSHAAYEYGAREPMPGIVPRSLPAG